MQMPVQSPSIKGKKTWTPLKAGDRYIELLDTCPRLRLLLGWGAAFWRLWNHPPLSHSGSDFFCRWERYAVEAAISLTLLFHHEIRGLNLLLTANWRHISTCDFISLKHSCFFSLDYDQTWSKLNNFNAQWNHILAGVSECPQDVEGPRVIRYLQCFYWNYLQIHYLAINWETRDKAGHHLEGTGSQTSLSREPDLLWCLAAAV